MVAFEKLGVFLNEEPGDDEALVFTARLAEFAQTRSIQCVHVRAMEDEFASPPPTADDVRRRILERLPPDLARSATVDVRQDRGLSEILRCARDMELDLIVVGRRLPHDDQAVGSVFTKLARKAPCSVLVVPHHARPHFARILVPVDGSEHSQMALRTAVDIARASGENRPQIVAQAIYSVGYGYQYTGVTYAQAVARMDEVTRERIEPMLASVDTSGVQFEFIRTCSHHAVAAVHDLVASRRLDLIVAGSRGRSTTPAMLLGTFAEGLLAESAVPLLIVRRKGETLRFLNALLQS